MVAHPSSEDVQKQVEILESLPLSSTLQHSAATHNHLTQLRQKQNEHIQDGSGAKNWQSQDGVIDLFASLHSYSRRVVLPAVGSELQTRRGVKGQERPLQKYGSGETAVLVEMADLPRQLHETEIEDQESWDGWPSCGQNETEVGIIKFTQQSLCLSPSRQTCIIVCIVIRMDREMCSKEKYQLLEQIRG
jgi:hypothetical protein